MAGDGSAQAQVSKPATASATAGPQLGGEIVVSALDNYQSAPSVAYHSKHDEYLVAWQNPQPDIYARFVSGDGSLDTTILHLDYTSVGEVKPKVTCNSAGSQFLAVWQQQYSSITGCTEFGTNS